MRPVLKPVLSPSSRFADSFAEAGCAQLDMAEDQQAMEVALRVLTAISTKLDPEPADVERLRQLEPQEVTLPIDELACAVIRRYGKTAGARG
jgi:hypothetical protein